MYYAFLGYLVKLHESEQLNDLQEISGSSAGALCAFCYLLSRDNMKEFVNESITQDLTALKVNLKTLVKKYGFINSDYARELISRYCFKFSYSPDITFKELYEKTKIKLHVSAFSLDKHQVDYFSVDTSPSMSIVDAIAMSICVPIIFSPFKNYIDGSVSEDIPYGPFMDKDIDDVFAIRGRNSKIRKFNSLYTYITSFVDVFYSIRHKCPIPYRSVYIDNADVSIFDFKMNTDSRFKLYSHGYTLFK